MYADGDVILDFQIYGQFGELWRPNFGRMVLFIFYLFCLFNLSLKLTEKQDTLYLHKK